MSNDSQPRATLTHDAFPESRWIYRRVLMFGFSILLAIAFSWVTILIGRIGIANHEASTAAIQHLTQIVLALTWLNGLLLVLYLVAPSGEQIAKMVAMVAALKTGGFTLGTPAVAATVTTPTKAADAGDQHLGGADEEDHS
jgi:uncharacterized BrkB/YihY/UPF0761 family membrane protein